MWHIARSEASVGVHFLRKIMSGSEVPNDSTSQEYGSGHPYLQVYAGFSWHIEEEIVAYSRMFHESCLR